MDIDMVVRVDSSMKGGGDLVQARAYASELTKLGHRPIILPWTPFFVPRHGAIVHYFNVDRTYEFLATSKAARKYGVPLFVSTIHHAEIHVERMRFEEGGSLTRRIASRVPAGIREAILHLLRTMREVGLSGAAKTALDVATAAPVWRNRVRRSLEAAQSVFVLTPREVVALEDDFSYLSSVVMTPNGNSIDPSEVPDWAQKLGIICVGRIEPRKRQLEILKSADQAGVGITFVGPLSETANSYGQEFAEYVARSATSNWTGPKSHPETIALIRNSRVLLNMSFVEVQSLVDLEAINSRCYVISSHGGTSPTAYPDVVHSFAIDETPDAIHHAARLARRNHGPTSVPVSPSWAETTAAIEAEYQKSVPCP